jgi:hypothetical protein
VHAARRAWIASGRVEDEASWLRARVEAGGLPSERLALAAYLGHPAALACAAELGPKLPQRLAVKIGVGPALRQVVLGLGDVCAAHEREVVAGRALARILALLPPKLLPEESASELLASARPWGALRVVANMAHEAFDEVGEDALRHALRAALVGWALSIGQEARAYESQLLFRVGERLSHPVYGEGFVARAGARAIEAEFGGTTRKLRHGRQL